jgi:ectoine hydroxylase-related dioxygenase (phytanoyl-CoA dioxygenase family)
MLSTQQIEFYRENGYLLVENAVTPEQLARMRDIAYGFIEKSRAVSVSDDVFDLDDGHSAQTPKLTRIKLPHKQHPYFWEVAKNSGITTVLKQLLGPDVLLQTSKLNTKAPGGGAAVEWHQDWAFYPHTNDDILACGLMLEDVDLANGPLQVIPGSHKGPVLSHNNKDGVFCGAVDPDDPDFHQEKAVTLTGKAWPLAGASSYMHRLGAKEFLDDLAARTIIGQPSLVPRMEKVPVRLPLPPAPDAGSIFKTQKTGGAKTAFAA